MPQWGETVASELYDHAADDDLAEGWSQRGENANLVDDAHADVRAQMRASLFAGWNASRPAAAVKRGW